MNINLLTKGTVNNTVTIFSVSHDGKLTAARPTILKFPPNRTNLTTIYKPQHVSTLLTAPQIELPTNYSSIDHYPAMKNVLNQGRCGSCWAYSTTSTLTDMFVVAGYDYLWLNPTPVLSCSFQNKDFSVNGNKSQGCNGSLPAVAFDYLSKKGTQMDKNYKISQQWNRQWQGPTNDSDSTNFLLYNKGCNFDGKYFAKKNSIKSCVLINDHNIIHRDKTINFMKTMIKLRGAITSKMMVFMDFVVGSKGSDMWKETDGVYIHNSANSLYKQHLVKNKLGNTVLPSKLLDGGHAVEIVGWGTKKKCPIYHNGKVIYTAVDYWLAKNSWGSAWGNLGGLFKIAMTGGGPSAKYDLECNKDIGFDFPIKPLGGNQQFGGAITFEPLIDLQPGHQHQREKYKSKKQRKRKIRKLHNSEMWVIINICGVLFFGFIWYLIVHFKIKHIEKNSKKK